MANEQNPKDGTNQDDDAVDPRQNEPRHGIPGKGFDAGTGYGGAGNASLYSGESSWGGQSGIGGNTMRGAYAGEEYGDTSRDELTRRADAQQGGPPNVGRDTDGRGSENRDRPVDPNTEAVTEAFEGQGGGRAERDRGPDAVDLQDMTNGGRRDPVR